jgi:3-methyl-2-oxobutanoate hydroxymethyltransferase
MLGLFDWTPKFVRRYADVRQQISQAVGAYAADVRARRFPGPAEVYFGLAG